jgi:hypothetical protein
MKVNTEKISLGILALYGVYGIFAIPFVYFILSIAVGLIVYSTSDSIEYTVVSVLLTGVLAVLISQARRSEGFVDSGPVISKRLASVRRPQATSPVGVYASGFVEGFSDLSDNPVPEPTKSDTPPATEPVPTADKLATAVAAVAAASKPATSTTPTTSSSSQPAKAGFIDANAAATDGLFKLGSIPQDTKGGFHIDQGTTVLNALNALQPDQVKKMSEDTQKLIDTQKSLMMMLGTMKPMLSDGKQLIDTFQTMFGPSGKGATL